MLHKPLGDLQHKLTGKAGVRRRDGMLGDLGAYLTFAPSIDVRPPAYNNDDGIDDGDGWEATVLTKMEMILARGASMAHAADDEDQPLPEGDPTGAPEGAEALHSEPTVGGAEVVPCCSQVGCPGCDGSGNSSPDSDAAEGAEEVVDDVADFEPLAED